MSASDAQVQFAYKVYRRIFRVPVRTSHGVWQTRDGILVRVEREDGRVGFGEVAPIERFGTETIAGALAWCASMGAAANVTRLRDIPRGLPCCAAAIASALAGVGTALAPTLSIAQGSATDGASAAPTGVGRLPVACLLPAGPGASDALARAADAGFTTFKLKIGTTDFATEASSVARTIEQLPSGGRLRLDANGGLEVRDAARWLEAATAWPVEFIEQPLSVEAERDLVRLAQDHSTPVALDESVRDADDIKRWRDHGWPGVFVIKPALAGAPDDWMREVRVTPDAFVFSSALETAIGAAAGLRLAFSAGVTRALGYGVGAFFEDDGLGGGVSRASLRSEDVAGWKLEDAWNRL